MSVNIAVCGKFHLHNHVRYVERAGLLNRFYYAAKRSTDAAELGIAPEHAVNCWLKEYLIRGHQKLVGRRGGSWAFPAYDALWQRRVLRYWSPAPLLHYMLHGNCRRLIGRARADGSRVVGEPVNSHPRFVASLLDEEHRRLGIDPVSGGEWEKVYRVMTDEAAASDWLIAGSPLVKRSYVEQGFDAGRFHVLPYGVDRRYFYPANETGNVVAGAGVFRVICVAQIVPRKGHVYLLEAWKRLSLPDAELLLIGEVHPGMHGVLARYHGLYRHVPRVPHRQLREHYARSSLFALPSVEDGFAYVVAEALGCGLPVITTENTGANVLVTEGKDGFIVPIRSPDAIAERIRMLYEDRTRLAEMAAWARAKANSDFSWEDYATRLVEFYRTVCGVGG